MCTTSLICCLAATRYKRSGFLMGASVDSSDESTCERVGLVSNHAYSILDLRVEGSTRLIRFRNPWGTPHSLCAHARVSLPLRSFYFNSVPLYLSLPCADTPTPTHIHAHTHTHMPFHLSFLPFFRYKVTIPASNY